MAADQNTHARRDHAATPDTQPTTMINLGYVALVQRPAQLTAQTDTELFPEILLEEASRVYGRDLLKVRWPAGIRG
jgi:hypothetical protein